MKIRILLLWVMILVVSVVPVYAHAQRDNASIYEVTDKVLKSGPDNNWFILCPKEKEANGIQLDVRAAADYQKSPALDTLNIPLTDLQDRLEELPKDKKIYITNQAGIAATYAVFVLRIHGFDAWIIRDACPMQQKQSTHHSQ